MSSPLLVVGPSRLTDAASPMAEHTASRVVEPRATSRHLGRDPELGRPRRDHYMNAFATRYKTATIEGLEVFYREAGNPANPTLLLLHGFPSSSHMFRNLINDLADQ